MIFLIHYRRSRGEMIGLQEFTDAQRLEAEEARLTLELSLMGQKDSDEVCLLDAPNIEALRVTHGRYFKNVKDLAEQFYIRACSHICLCNYPPGVTVDDAVKITDDECGACKCKRQGWLENPPQAWVACKYCQERVRLFLKYV
jgi:hypothetical protein